MGPQKLLHFVMASHEVKIEARFKTLKNETFLEADA